MALRLASEVRQGTSREGEGREKKQWLGSHHGASCLASCRRRRGEERRGQRDETNFMKKTSHRLPVPASIPTEDMVWSDERKNEGRGNGDGGPGKQGLTTQQACDHRRDA